MRAFGVRPCRVTRALSLVCLGYGASVHAAEPAPATTPAAAAPAKPAPPPASPPAAPAPAAPAPASGPAPAPWNSTPEPNPYPPAEVNPYPPPPPYYQPPPGSYPPGYYPGYPPQVRVEALPPNAAQAADTPAPSSVKPARRGFQLGLRTGLSIPMGDATGASNDTLARRYSWQFPLAADVGWKFTDALFIGGYLGVGFGGIGSDAVASEACDDDDYDDDEIDCSSFGLQIGAQAIYSLDPGAQWNPWVGYGIGFESARQAITHDGRNYAEANTSSGITAAKLMFGADHRGNVGFGPFVEVAIGRYLRTNTQVNDESTHSGSISNQAFHAWLTFGVRLVVMP